MLKNIKNLLGHSGQGVKFASALLAIAALLSNILGLGRNLVFYRYVSASHLDVYFASFRIPDLIFNLLIFGAITSAFIPIVSGLIAQKKEEEALRVTNQLLTWATLFFVLCIAVLSILAPTILQLMLPGFQDDRLQLTINMTRIMLWQTLFFSWSFIIGGLLNGYQRFLTYSLAPLIYNISLILGGLLVPRYGLYTMAWAVVIGSILHLLIQLYEVWKTGYRPHWTLQFSSSIKEILHLMIPRGLSQGMAQVVLVGYTTLASSLQAGSLAVFSGINDLQTTPTVIVANSLATASFPALAAAVACNDKQKLSTLLNKTIRSALFILVPSVALGMVLRAQIVRIYIGMGDVNWDLTRAGIATFAWFMIGIIPASIVTIMSRVFYAHKNSRTPMVISIIGGIIAIITAVLSIKVFHMNVAGLAIGEVALASFQFVAYTLILHKNENVIFSYKDILRALLSFTSGATLACITAWLILRLVNYTYQLFQWNGTEYIIGIFIQGILAGVSGLIVYVLYSKVKSLEEWKWISQNSFIKGR